MIIDKSKLNNLEVSSSYEWLLTNGIGGYSSSTILNLNTRRYHGLLVAALNPPAVRNLILSKIDESIFVGNRKYELFTNQTPNSFSHGHKYLIKFEKTSIPKFIYKVEDVIIEKKVCLEYGKNTVIIKYKIKNAKKDSKIMLAPIVNFRDFHSLKYEHELEFNQKEQNNETQICINNNTPIKIWSSCGKYIKHNNDYFKNMYYKEEDKRGFYATEDHIVPGVFEVDIKPNETKHITVICSLEDSFSKIDGDVYIKKEQVRCLNLIKKAGCKELFQSQLALEADKFIVKRKSNNLSTIIAGYPYFADWGRDSLIALEGLLLKTSRFNEAKEVILTYTNHIAKGLVPNGFSEYDNKPLYNSVDASLLLFENVYKYVKYTGDYDFVFKEIYPKLKDIISNYKEGTDNKIYLDKDGLISCGDEKTQITWMDAQVNGNPVTPRAGKVVEINAMWYNALMIMFKFSQINGENDKEYIILANQCKKSFNNKFYNAKENYLYDVLGDEKIRPNALFAASLSFPIISAGLAKELITKVNEELFSPYGLKTLSSKDKDYKPYYSGNSEYRDSAYHQGTVWPWLFGLYFNTLNYIIKSEENINEKEKYIKKYNNFVRKIKDTFKEELKKDCIGSISEIYDAEPIQHANGCFAQAWSVAEILRIITD